MKPVSIAYLYAHRHEWFTYDWPRATVEVNGVGYRVASVQPASPPIENLYEVRLLGMEGCLYAQPDAVAYIDQIVIA